MAMAYEQRFRTAISSERMKTNAAGAAGVFIGIGLGEYVGTYVGKAAAPTGTSTQQHWYSLATKLAIGIVLLLLNNVGGLGGVLIWGIALGSIGSMVTDVFVIAGQGSLIGMAEKAALSGQRQARTAGNVFVESARQTQTMQNRPPQQITTVSVTD